MLKFIPSSQILAAIRNKLKLNSIIRRTLFSKNQSIAMKLEYEKIEEIVKPLEDKRNYLGLKLKNQLNVLLISDPETDISSASLCVHIGSMSDPPFAQGLAHFLEHMLFMGTKKYPIENDYDKFLSQHGGCSNAYTTEFYTNFFFEVGPEYLAASLDRFAQFFIDPLMLEGSVNRELEAVNSEFDKNLKNDFWRKSQIKKLLGNPKHDFNKFTCGNYKTLRDSFEKSKLSIRDELIKFHEKWYSANIMKLCVYGKESIDELVDMVVPLFSPIVNKNVINPVWNEHPYDAEHLMKQVYMVPIKEKRSLDISFVYPDETKYYNCSPGLYLSHLIGHESKGSLLSELKRCGLASSLISSCVNHDGFGFFHIMVDLTEESLNRIDEVVQIIFQYINMLKTEGPQEYIFEEYKGLNYIKFNFMEKTNPIEYVHTIASSMQYFPLKDVLGANFLMDTFRPDLINEHISYLKPENCNIIIMSKSFDGKTDQKEEYYDTDYKLCNMSKELLDKLKNPGLNENLKLPEPNLLIPKNFNIIQSNEKNSNVPILLKKTEKFIIWHLQDQVYLKPKAFYGFKIANPIAYSNPYTANIISLISILFQDYMTEFLYNAELAGLQFKFKNTIYGFDMRFYGYNDKMQIFLYKIFEHLINFKVCPQRFEILKEKYSRNLKSYQALPLYNLTNYYLKCVTNDKVWNYEDLIATLDQINANSIQNTFDEIFKNCSIESFFYGNINQTQALDIMNFIDEKFFGHYKTVPLKKYQRTIPRLVALEPGSYYSYEIINDVQKPKAITVHFQITFDDLVETSKLLLVHQILCEPFFNILRSKEQLGYVVHSAVNQHSGVYGLNFTIQSDYNVSYLEDRIEAFLVQMKTKISEMTDEEFNTEKNSLITKLLKKKKRMSEYSNELWFQINLDEYHFTKHKDQAEIVKTLTKNDISAFFNKYLAVDSEERKKLVIKILKSNAEENANVPTDSKDVQLLEAPPRKVSTSIQDVAEFIKYKSLYPLPKPKVSI